MNPAILANDPRNDRIVGRSPAIRDMCAQIGRIAAQDVTALILGESGVGKELAARAIYSHSKRWDMPFIAVNCAGIPEEAIEIELFGRETETYTGVGRQHVGRLEQFSNGTLLLEEIDELSPVAQARLLELLQERRFVRVGGSRPLTSLVRVLAATKQDLERLVFGGRFRSDLYLELTAATVQVPPLRARKEDIPELAHCFLFKYSRESNSSVRGFSAEVLDLFQRYDWPGNVRELENCVKGATCQASGSILLPGDFPDLGSIVFPLTDPTCIHNLTATIDGMLSDGKRDVHSRVIALVERELFVRALRQTRGNHCQASELLGIYWTTLQNRMRELGITHDKSLVDSVVQADA